MNPARFSFWCASAVAAWYLLHGGLAAAREELSLLLAVVLCLCGVIVLGRAREKDVERTHMRSPAAAAWLGLALVILFLAAMLARVPAVRMIHAWGEMFPAQSASFGEDPSDGEDASGAWLREDGTRRSLPRKTNIKPGRKPEVFLRIEDAALARRSARHPLYVAAITFDHYRDSAWEIAAEPARMLEPDAGGVIAIDDNKPDGGVWHTVVLSADVNQRAPLAGLQGISRVEGTGLLERWSAGFHLLPRSDDTAAGYRYRACSHPLRLEEVTGEIRDPQNAGGESRWLEIPADDLGRRVAELVASTVKEVTPLGKLKSIQHHLRRNYGYSLATQNHRDLDPLENFLFEEKSGHCEYFATAGALMARASGIPARVVYGWAGGTWYEHADWFVFRADEAHAWVEAWVDGRGWVIMDPTPPEALGDRAGRASREKLPPMPDGADEMLENQDDPPVQANVADFPWVAAGLSGLLAGAVLFWRYASRVRLAGGARFAAEPWRHPSVVSHYLEEWREACGLLHPRRDMMASTLRQQLDWAETKPEFADDLVRYHYGIRYHGQPPDRVKERELTRRIRAWAADLLE